MNNDMDLLIRGLVRDSDTLYFPFPAKRAQALPTQLGNKYSKNPSKSFSS